MGKKRVWAGQTAEAYKLRQKHRTKILKYDPAVVMDTRLRNRLRVALQNEDIEQANQLRLEIKEWSKKRMSYTDLVALSQSNDPKRLVKLLPPILKVDYKERYKHRNVKTSVDKVSLDIKVMKIKKNNLKYKIYRLYLKTLENTGVLITLPKGI